MRYEPKYPQSKRQVCCECKNYEPYPKCVCKVDGKAYRAAHECHIKDWQHKLP